MIEGQTEGAKTAAADKKPAKTYPKATKTTLVVNVTKFFAVPGEKLVKLPNPFTFMDMLAFVQSFVPGFQAINHLIITGQRLDKRQQAGYTQEIFDLENGSICVLGDEVVTDKTPNTLAAEIQKKRPPSPAKKPTKKAGTAEALGIASTSGAVQKPAQLVQRSVYDPATLKKYDIHGLLPSLRGTGKSSSALSREEIRTALIENIRSYNQLRDLEDKNLENMKNLKYSTKNDKLKKAAEVLQADDIGGFVYDDVQGYELENLIEVGSFLEDKPMEVEDWVHLYKHLVDYFGD